MLDPRHKVMKRRGRPKLPLELSPRERRELESLESQAPSRPRLARRAEIILACATGATNSRVGRDLGVSSATVGKWRQRFIEHRLAGLRDAPRSGAPRRIAEEDVEKVVRLTLEPASDAATVWSTRSLADATGMSQAAISRIWRAFSVKPGSGPQADLVEIPFPVYVRNFVGVYLSAGEQALVLLANQPPAPGTTVVGHPAGKIASSASLRALVAAAQDAKTVGDQKVGWGPLLRFLAEIDRQIPRRVVVHVLLAKRRDSRATLAHRWAAQRTRFRLHFVESEDSWLERAERALAARRELLQRRGPTDFEAALEKRLEQGGGWPYRWTKFEAKD